MLEYRTPVQQRILFVIVSLLLGLAAFPDGGDGSHWILTFLQLSWCALISVALCMEVRFVVMGNPPVWSISNNVLEVRTWFMHATFAVDSVSITVVGGNIFGSTVISDANSRITLSCFDFPPAQRDVLTKATTSYGRSAAHP